MSQAQNNSTVKVHYTMKLDDGTIVDSSTQRDPIEFTIGEGSILPGIEQEVIGMSPGDSKTVHLSPDQAHGERRDDLLIDVERSQLPEGLDPSVGQNLQVEGSDGQVESVTVNEVFENQIRLDANHPLAGRELICELELLETD